MRKLIYIPTIHELVDGYLGLAIDKAYEKMPPVLEKYQITSTRLWREIEEKIYSAGVELPKAKLFTEGCINPKKQLLRLERLARKGSYYSQILLDMAAGGATLEKTETSSFYESLGLGIEALTCQRNTKRSNELYAAFERNKIDRNRDIAASINRGLKHADTSFLFIGAGHILEQDPIKSFLDRDIDAGMLDFDLGLLEEAINTFKLIPILSEHYQAATF